MVLSRLNTGFDELLAARVDRGASLKQVDGFRDRLWQINSIGETETSYKNGGR